MYWSLFHKAQKAKTSLKGKSFSLEVTSNNDKNVSVYQQLFKGLAMKVAQVLVLFSFESFF